MISYYICTGLTLSDRFRPVPLGTGRNWSDSEPVEPTGSTGSDRNPVGKIGEISYCLAYTVIQNFRSESNQFQPVPIGTCGAQQRPQMSIKILLKYFLFCNIFFSEIAFCGMLFPQAGRGGWPDQALKNLLTPGFYLIYSYPLTQRWEKGSNEGSEEEKGFYTKYNSICWRTDDVASHWKGSTFIVKMNN